MTDVYFATNREPRPKSRPRNFGRNFSGTALSDLRFGKAVVSGNRVDVFTNKEKLVRQGATLHTDESRTVLGSQKVFDEMHQRMHKSGRDTVLFIHGYNVTFKAAMKTAAKLADNLAGANGGLGVNAACFSWPSDGSMAPWLAYSSDRRDAAASAAAFARGLLKMADFLCTLTEAEACDQKVHLVAHSMGNYVLRHALQEVRRQSPGRIPRLFGQIFLMAADEDDDAFEYDYKLKLLPRLGRHVNIYFNRNDRAMAISDTTKGNPDRLGDDGPRAPFLMPGKVSQIDCTPVATGLIEHSYFLDSLPVVADMTQVINGTDPAKVAGRIFMEDRNRFVIVG